MHVTTPHNHQRYCFAPVQLTAQAKKCSKINYLTKLIFETPVRFELTHRNIKSSNSQRCTPVLGLVGVVQRHPA